MLQYISATGGLLCRHVQETAAVVLCFWRVSKAKACFIRFVLWQGLLCMPFFPFRCACFLVRP